MIVAMIITFYIFILFYLYGTAFIHGVGRILRQDVGDAIDLPLTLLTGLATVAVIAMTANLFIPLGSVFFVSLLAGALIIAFQKRLFIRISFPRYHPLTWLILIVMSLAVLENISHAPGNSDTGLYHAQTIHWFEEYRAVPGLGNLHARLAFNSSWLVLSASLSLAFLGLQSFRLVGGVLFLSTMFYFVEGLDALIRKRLSISIIFKIFSLPLSFYLFSSEISSVGTDMPISLITWCVLIAWVEMFESRSKTSMYAVVLFLLSLFAVTIKLASLPLLFFALFIVMDQFTEVGWRNVFVFVALALAVLVPWMFRSVILSGYLVFPVHQIDIFHVDWKMSGEQLEAARRGIIGFARFHGTDWQSSLDVGLEKWMPIWFERQTLNRKLIYALVLLSPLFMLVNRFRYPLLCHRRYQVMYFICAVGTVFWFFTAPDIRFGYGFLVGACLASLSPFLMDIYFRLDRDLKFVPLTVFFIILMFQIYSLVFSFDTPSFTRRWLLPIDYLPSKANACEISNGWVYCQRERSQCHYDVFPCIPNPRPNVEMRGPTFHDGFRNKT
jgi:hypothetical protein